jgi:halocyanin-like protein
MVDSPDRPLLDRRTVLRSVGALAVGTAIAGCTNDTGRGEGGGDGGGGDGESDGSEGSDGEGSDGSGGGDGAGGDGSGSDGSDGGGGGGADATVDGGGVSASDAEDYASESSNFSGVEDMTGQDGVEVVVGAEGNSDNFAFDPPAVKVSEGSTVTWRWSGQGGTHNVVAEGEEFNSGDAVSEEGTTYAVEFAATGAWRYYCMPHQSLGMVGAVIVE